jgi:hypothetical protein
VTQPVQKQDAEESFPRPRTSPNRKPPLQIIAGGTGLKQSSGIIFEEWHRRLQGIRGVRTFREMADNSAIIGAMLYAMVSLIKQVPRTTKPAQEDDEKSAKAKQHLDECFEDMSHTFDDWLEEILSMLPFGWSNFETVYKIRRGDSPDPRFRSRFSDGLVGWRKFVIKPQDALTRWEIDEDDGGIKGMWVITDKGEEKFLPIEKSALFRIKAHKNNPEGKSLLRNAFLDWYYAKHLTEVEAIGIERDLAGLPKMEVPPDIMEPGASPEKVSLRADYEDLVQNIRRDDLEGLVVPAEEITLADGTAVKTGYRFTLVSTGGTRSIDASAAIVRHEQRMAMSVLMEFLFLGMDKVGSFSLASSKTAIFATALKAVVNSIQAVINRFVIPRLFGFMRSTFPEGTWPTLEFGDIETPDLAELSAFVSSLTTAGILLPDAGIERHLRSVSGLPEPEEEEADEAGIRGELFRYHLEAGIVTINEVREVLGLEPIKGGEEPTSFAQAFERVAKQLGIRPVDVAKAHQKAPSKFDRDYADILAKDDLGLGDG